MPGGGQLRTPGRKRVRRNARGILRGGLTGHHTPQTHGRKMNCEYCGDEIQNGEFGDVRGAIVCPNCLGWYDHTPNPQVALIVAEMEKEMT